MCEEGAAADSAYIVLRGRLLALVGREGEPSVVGEIGPGEIIGEIALLFGDRRSATMLAIRESELAEISRESFARLLDAEPHFAVALCRLLAARIVATRQARTRPPPPARIVALRPLTEGLETGGIARELARAAGRARRRVGVIAPANGATPAPDAVALLERLEREHDLLLTWTAREAPAWSQAALAVADRVLLLVRPGAPLLQPWSDLPRVGLEQRYRVGAALLVLVHPPGTAIPRGTRDELARLPRLPHRHLREGDARHLERLARTVAGDTVALVMGGGGARGFAHLGVHRALLEAGIDVDMVTGTSMGAILAAAIATDAAPDAILARLRTTFVERNPANDWTLPVASLLAGRKAERAFREAFGGLDLEDLWRPCLFVSTNLSRARAHVEATGPVWLALRATTAIPGVFPPVVRGGELFVDGGLVDNLPVDVARRCFRPRRIVAVDVAAGRGPEAPGLDAPALAPLGVLRSRFGPGPRLPDIVDILWAASVLASEVNAEPLRREADLLVRPDLEGFPMLDWRPLEAIVEAGYRAAVAALEAREREVDGFPAEPQPSGIGKPEQRPQPHAHGIAGERRDRPQPAVQAARGDAREVGADVAAEGEPGAVAEQKPADDGRRE